MNFEKTTRAAFLNVEEHWKLKYLCCISGDNHEEITKRRLGQHTSKVIKHSMVNLIIDLMSLVNRKRQEENLRLRKIFKWENDLALFLFAIDLTFAFNVIQVEVFGTDTVGLNWYTFGYGTLRVDNTRIYNFSLRSSYYLFFGSCC